MPSIARTLDAEWVRLARSVQARRAVARWASDHPALAGAADLDAILDRRREPSTSRAVLRSLAELAPEDTLAARALLQALLPGLMTLAGNIGRSDPDAVDELVSLAWERIRTYPAERPGAVAANVLWDVRKRYRRHREIEAPATSCDPSTAADPTVPSAEEQAIERIEVAAMAAAFRAAKDQCPGLRLVARTRFGGESLEAIAAEERINVHALRQRRWRSECRLRELAQAS